MNKKVANEAVFDIEAAITDLPPTMPREPKTTTCDLPGCEGFRRRIPHDHTEWIRKELRYRKRLLKIFPNSKIYRRRVEEYERYAAEIDAGIEQKRVDGRALLRAREREDYQNHIKWWQAERNRSRVCAVAFQHARCKGVSPWGVCECQCHASD